MNEDVSQTLARPDLHEQWIENFRVDEVNEFTWAMLRRVLERVDLPDKAAVLDAGCGSGTNSTWLARRGLTVTGVDFSRFALGKAEERAAAEGLDGAISFRHGDLTALQFADGQFDAGFCLGVLMHIPDLESALAELARVVRAGGYLILGEANADAWETRAFRLDWRLFRPEFRVERNERGVEVWAQTAAGPLLSRKVSVPWLTGFLRDRGFERERLTTGELTELYIYLKNPFARRAVHRLNRLWLDVRGPPTVAIDNLLVFRKL